MGAGGIAESPDSYRGQVAVIFIGLAPFRLLPLLGFPPVILDRRSGLVASGIQQAVLEAVQPGIHYQPSPGESPVQLFGFRSGNILEAERIFEFAVAVEQECDQRTGIQRREEGAAFGFGN